MQRSLRLIIASNGPPIMGWAIMTGIFSIEEGSFELSDFDLAFLLMSYFFVGLQSLIFAIFMEFIVPRYTKRIYEYIFIGALVGYLSGISASIIIENEIGLISIWSMLGIFVGVSLSIILVKLNIKLQKAS